MKERLLKVLFVLITVALGIILVTIVQKYEIPSLDKEKNIIYNKTR